MYTQLKLLHEVEFQPNYDAEWPSADHQIWCGLLVLDSRLNIREILQHCALHLPSLSHDLGLVEGYKNLNLPCDFNYALYILGLLLGTVKSSS